jgi:glycosyltransferase involved in cell wall biosynthesis
VKTLVAFAEVAWGYFRTRKQFLLARLAARGWRVVYLEPVAQGRGNAWAPRTEDGVTIVTVPFLKTVTRQPLYNAATEFAPVRAALEGLARRAVKDALARLGVARTDVAYVSNPYAVKALSAAGAALVCYDFNDHPLQFAGVPAWAGGYLERALARADVVLAVSAHYARELASRVAAPVVVFGNGVEFERFADPAARVPPALAGIATPRVGYMGKVSHFLDFDVLERLATAGGFELVVIGPVPAETRAAVDRLRALPHAHVLGEVPYADVPGALAGLDVALIPFRAGDPFTYGINPNKLYQYWAAGRPIVASPIADMRADGAGLSFASTPAEFEAAVRAVLARPAAPEAVRERARAHDWDRLAERLDALLTRALDAKRRAGTVQASDLAPLDTETGDAS